jgi:hypothetical protein
MNIDYILGVNLTFDYYSLVYVRPFVLLLVRYIQRMLKVLADGLIWKVETHNGKALSRSRHSPSSESTASFKIVSTWPDPPNSEQHCNNLTLFLKPCSLSRNPTTFTTAT